jgi:hypothetical protein
MLRVYAMCLALIPWRLWREQSGNRNAEHGCEYFKSAQRDIAFTALHRTDIGAVQATHVSEVFLGELLRFAEFANVRGQCAGDGGARLAQ